jgi:peroxiredoxin
MSSPQLLAGQLAPSFAAVDIYDRPISLDAYVGKRVLVMFYRSAVCPLCIVHFLHMQEHELVYRRSGLYLVAFFDCSAGRAHAFLDRFDPAIPVIADPERRVYRRYGLDFSWMGVVRARLTRGEVYRKASNLGVGGTTVESLWKAGGSLARMPGEFLIGPDLHVGVAHYGRDAGDFVSESTVQSFLLSARRNG